MTDVLVIGAGPAGIAVATEAAQASLDVTVVDENPKPGGQIWRQPLGASPPKTASDGRGQALPERVRFLGSTVCAGFSGDLEALLYDGRVLRSVRARAVVLATGASERVLPVPGWQLPGVMTAGAAQTMLKGSGLFPYHRVVVAGTGPLLLATAAQLVAAGIEVAAVVEAARPGPADIRRLPALLAAGRLVADGGAYLSRLARARVPVRAGYGIAGITGVERVDGIRIRRLNADWSLQRDFPDRTIACDAVLLSYGFSSSVDIAVQLGARIDWDGLRQSWMPERSTAYETSIPMVFAAGDCAGVAGAQVAVLEGAVVGMTIAERLAGRPVDTGRVRRVRRQLNRLGRFRRTMDELSLIRPGAWTWAEDATVVCRCQGTTVADLSDAAAHGATTLRALKLGTRAGMGLCQGRVCAPIIAGLVGAAGLTGPDPRSEAPRARFPVKPIPAGAIAEWSDRHEL